MDQLNYVSLVFAFLTLFMILMGSLVISFEKYLPVFISQAFRYGKFAYTGKGSFIKPIEIPKSWFKHFYNYSAVITCFSLMMMISTIVFEFSLPHTMYDFLDMLGGSARQARVSNASALLAMCLLTMQCLRRCYDTNFVSVFGKNSRMNLGHYLLGFIHYTGAVLAILLETPRFTRSKLPLLRLQDLGYVDAAASVLFLWAWWHQYKVTAILANLRKDGKGTVVSQRHKLPHGDWFKYVSSPHMLTEVLMYVALTVILWNNITWLYIFTWVLSNQVESALLSHWWYQRTFKDFPKDRRALIPFIY